MGIALRLVVRTNNNYTLATFIDIEGAFYNVSVEAIML